MHNNLIKIFCFFILFGGSLSSLSQKKIKFGYHDQSGRVKKITTKAKEEKHEDVVDHPFYNGHSSGTKQRDYGTPF